MTYRYLFLTLILTSLFLILNSNAYAQEATQPAVIAPTPVPIPDAGLRIAVSPPTLDLRTEPGSSVSAAIKIKNNNYTESENLKIELMKFRADETGAKPLLEPISSEDLFPQWLNFSETEFVIGPETWKTIDFTFSPPPNAAPAYYFAIVINRPEEIAITEGQVAHGAVAVLCLVQVSSSRVYHQLDLAQLADGKGIGFTTDRKIYEFLPVNFTTTINNNGNVHEKAFGNIFINWVTGNQSDVEILNVNQEQSYTLPQTTRSFISTWNNGFPHWEDQLDDSGNPIVDKNNKVKRKLVWDLSKIPTFRIGKYRAILTLIYNDGVRDIPLEAQTEFWVIPWRILLALLVIVTLILIGLKGTLQSVFNKLKSARQRLSR